MTREELRFKCPVPVEDIQKKKVHASFSRDNGATVESGIGDIMVATNAAGLSLGWIQFRDDVNGQWVRVYLNEDRVRLLKNTDDGAFDFVIEPTLDAGPELED